MTWPRYYRAQSTDLVETSIDNFIADDLKVVLNFHSVSDKTADVLVGHDVPDPVTGQHQELIQHLVASLYVEFRFRGNCNQNNCQTQELKYADDDLVYYISL